MTPFLRSILCVAALTVSVRALPAQAQQKSGDVLIGYVNLQRAILETEEGKRAAKSLKSTFDEKQKRLTAKETELMKLKEQMDKEPAGKEDESRKKLGEKIMELRQTFMKEQQELQEAERKQFADISVKMRKTIEGIGQSGGYTIILEGQEARLLFAKNHLDLTNEVIRAYNTKNK